MAEVRGPLARERDLLRRVLETTSDAILITDRERRVSFANSAADSLFGVPSTVGMPVRALVPPDQEDAVRTREDRAFAGEPQRYEAVILRPDGERRHVAVSTGPLRDGDQVVGVVASLRDVTDEKRLTDQLVQQEKLAAVGQLVSGVAHELNNPLAAVLAFTQLLLATPSTDVEQRNAIETIHSETKRAAKIVANLLTFARQQPPERRVTDLNRIVADTLELRRYALRVSQIEVVEHLDPDLPPAWADSFQLQQVVLNLLANAEQALAKWEGERRITVLTRHVSDRLEIVVTDTGRGIASADLPRIFNPFFTTKPVGEGTGLGLSISHGIVREHGGRLRVESTVGRGSTFVIELPHVRPAAMQPAPKAAPDARRLASKETAGG